MNTDWLHSLCWPRDQLHLALVSLARHSGLGPAGAGATQGPGAQADLNSWLADTAATLDLQAQCVSSRLDQLEPLLAGAAPALVRLRFGNEERFLALCRGGRHRLQVLCPDLTIGRLATARVAAQLAESLAAPQRKSVEQLLDDAGVSRRRRWRAARTLLQQRLGGETLDDCWLLRAPAHRPFRQQLRRHGLYRRGAALLSCHTLQVSLFLASWWVIGRALLSGHGDSGWLAAWVLLLVSQVPLALLATRLQGDIAIDLGALLKTRLLASALRMAPGKVRHLGSGQVLSRVFDAEHIEADTLHGGFLLLLGAVELALAVPVLLLGAGGTLQLLALPLFLLLAFVLGRRQYHRRRQWTARRLALTHDLIEKMTGHRTRLAQQAPTQWHRGEDRELGNYLRDSTAMDTAMAQLVALLPRAWLLLGIAGLAPAFVAGGGGASTAIALGGVLLGYRAAVKAVYGYTSAVNALVAWEKVRQVFALAPPPARAAPLPATRGNCKENPQQPLCYLRDLHLHYPGKQRPALAGCSLVIRHGEHLLLRGASGSGKSTLANALTGTQPPDDGLLLVQGYDRASLGADGWHRLVASAPQFHENHVLAETFLFNLLLGDRWPPSHDSLRRAHTICHQLGLTPLLEKMPAGMLQTVGEMGWQLSHGERSRLFIARALLQNSELLVLDESFGALDPRTLRQSLDCVKQHAKTLLVIAHP
ncbi:ATP-binding cassette domain-containing protein [Microbulbifer sp. TYP-18]|uniref:ATP-binding cassette domain-containing protein n=1 Tax=Microbulbifer sp. TYP-18 TaxID=3230024 RepID=UPI0034C5B74B